MNECIFDGDLFGRINRVLRPGDVISTLGLGRPNRIVSVDRAGLFVETERSDEKGTGPQLVPAWMIATAWDHLRAHGRITNQELLNDLNVKRSAFVCALLARFAEVEIESVRPIALRLKPVH